MTNTTHIHVEEVLGKMAVKVLESLCLFTSGRPPLISDTTQPNYWSYIMGLRCSVIGDWMESLDFYRSEDVV